MVHPAAEVVCIYGHIPYPVFIDAEYVGKYAFRFHEIEFAEVFFDFEIKGLAVFRPVNLFDTACQGKGTGNHAENDMVKI